MEYLTIKEVAKRWDMSRMMIYRALYDRKMQAIQLVPRGGWRIPMDEVERIEAQGRLR